jgi:hypothetical protein
VRLVAIMLVRRAILGFLCFMASSACGNAQILTFPGICDASAAIAIDDRTIIVGDDEKPWLSTYDLDTQKLREPTPLPLASPASRGHSGSPEADIEGATVYKGRIIWISSHRRNKHGEVERDRFQLFASHTIDQREGTARKSFSASFHDLLPMLINSGDH